MADLTVNSSMLDELKHIFSTVTGTMHAVQRTLRNADGTVVGASNLVDDVHGFADDWSYGISQLGQHTDNAVKMIEQIGKTFSQADIELANGLGVQR